MIYRERLWPGPGMFLAAALVMPIAAFITMPLLQKARIPLWWSVPAALLAYALVILWLRFMSPQVVVSSQALTAGHVSIAVEYLGECQVFRGQAAKQELGLGMDARSWRLTRGWVKPLVRISITDPNDPTPYWLVSTRWPEQLAAALELAKTDSPDRSDQPDSCCQAADSA